jgi:hypothetical protein
MKKLFSIFPIAFFALTLHAQSMPAAAAAQASQSANAAVSHSAAQAQTSQAANAAAQAGQASAQAAEATHLSAELTRRIDTRHTRVGDKVFAKTTRAARLPNGVKLPRGTRLLGRVTHVQARSRNQHAAQLAFTFDHAILRHGRSIPIHAVLTSVSAPSAMADANTMSGMNAGPMGGGGMAGGGAMAAPAPPGGGLVGGGMVGGALHGAGGAVGQGTAMMNNNLNAAGRMGAGMARGMDASAMGDAMASEHAMSVVSGTPMPVPHLPGVLMSSSAGSTDSGTFSSTRRNFALDSGTQMNMDVTSANSNASASGSAAGSVHGSAHHPVQRN